VGAIGLGISMVAFGIGLCFSSRRYQSGEKLERQTKARREDMTSRPSIGLCSPISGCPHPGTPSSAAAMADVDMQLPKWGLFMRKLD
jgi:hypothetical protein